MIIKFEDKEYQFDLEEITLREASILYQKYELTLVSLENAFVSGNPAAMRAFYWLMLAQNGQVEDIERLDCKVVKLARAVNEAYIAEHPELAKAEESPKEDSPA